jgi:hypothetical protein
MAYPVGVPRCEAKGTGPGRCWRAGTAVRLGPGGSAIPVCPQHADESEARAAAVNR